MAARWVVTAALLAVILRITDSSEIKCLCTTPSCQESNEPICITSGLCYTQLLDKKDGSNPITKGCVNRKTPLLCENRPPKSISKRLKWPILSCCSSDLCNQGDLPFTQLVTHVTEDINETTSSAATKAPVVTLKNATETGRSRQTGTEYSKLSLDGVVVNRNSLANPAVLTVFCVGLLALLAIGVVGCCVLHRQKVN